MLDEPIVHQYFSDVRTEWYFNLEKAPWWGERMVKSTKRCLKRTIGQAKLTYDELSTVVTEVKMIINSHPLSHVSTEDLQELLTPSHLLIGHWLLSLSELAIQENSNDPDFQVGPLTVVDFTRRLRHLSKTMDQFWKRWSKEYLLELRECRRFGKWTQSPPCDPIVIGDIVLVYDRHHTRTFWRLAKVEDLIMGSDGKYEGPSFDLFPREENHLFLGDQSNIFTHLRFIT